MPTLDDVYRKFGEVAEAAQLLETELGTMQLGADGEEHDLFAGDKGELATEIYNKINKSTLGHLLKRLAKSTGFTSDLELLLANALVERTSYSIRSTESTTSGGTQTKAVQKCSKTLSEST